MSKFVGCVPLCVSQAVTAAYFKGEVNDRITALKESFSTNYIHRHTCPTGHRLLAVGRRGMHSSDAAAVSHPFLSMRVRVLPALADNYMYLVIDEKSKEAAIVDPVEPQSVVKAVEEENVKLTAILTTHHHWDHAGGNEKMAAAVSGLTVYGGDDRIGALNKKVAHGDLISVGGIRFRCLFTPCHTSGHICYYADAQDEEGAVFTGKQTHMCVLNSHVTYAGDTLFLGGCGRFFEGTAGQMHKALVQELGQLPDQTVRHTRMHVTYDALNEQRVYFGHEYSVSNLKFALHVEPENESVKEKLHWCKKQRAKQPPMPSTPSTIGIQLLMIFHKFYDKLIIKLINTITNIYSVSSSL